MKNPVKVEFQNKIFLHSKKCSETILVYAFFEKKVRLIERPIIGDMIDLEDGGQSRIIYITIEENVGPRKSIKEEVNIGNLTDKFFTVVLSKVKAGTESNKLGKIDFAEEVSRSTVYYGDSEKKSDIES